MGRKTKAGKESSLTLFASPNWRSKMPWPMLTTIGALSAAFAGWFIVVAFALLGWMEVPELPLEQPLGFAVRIWLLAHGSPIRLAGSPLSIPPLGLSLLLLIVVSGLAGWVGGHVQLTSSSARGKWLLRIAGLFTVEYAIVVVAIASAVIGSRAVLPTVIGALLLGSSSLFSAARAMGISVHDELVQRLPGWATAIPKAIGAGVLLLIGVSAVAVTVSLVVHRERVTFLQDSLGAGTLGTVLLVIGQLAYLPNLVLWASGWVTGAGIALGTDTIMSPVANQVGMLPTIPLFGLVPETGVAPWYHSLWLAAPVVIGIIVAKVALIRISPRVDEPARADFTALVGGLTALMSGVIVSALAWLAGGDLGEVRLIDLGVRWPAMIIIAPTLLGFAGLFAGLIIGLRRPVRPVSTPGTSTTPTTELPLSARDLDSTDSVDPSADLADPERSGKTDNDLTAELPALTETSLATDLPSDPTDVAKDDLTEIIQAATRVVEGRPVPADLNQSSPLAADRESELVPTDLNQSNPLVADRESELVTEELTLPTEESDLADPEFDVSDSELDRPTEMIAKLVESVENAYRRDAGLDEISRS